MITLSMFTYFLFIDTLIVKQNMYVNQGSATFLPTRTIICFNFLWRAAYKIKI